MRKLRRFVNDVHANYRCLRYVLAPAHAALIATRTAWRERGRPFPQF